MRIAQVIQSLRMKIGKYFTKFSALPIAKQIIYTFIGFLLFSAGAICVYFEEKQLVTFFTIGIPWEFLSTKKALTIYCIFLLIIPCILTVMYIIAKYINIYKNICTIQKNLELCGITAYTTKQKKNIYFKHNYKKIQQIFEKNKLFSNVWAKFSETFIIQNTYYTPYTADTFINEHTVLIDNYNKGILTSVPGYFTCLGILGTFWGLAAGIEMSTQLFSSAEHTQDLRTVLEPILSGAGLAFITSLVGLVCSLATSILEKYLYKCLIDKLQELTNLLDSCLQMVTTEKFSQQILAALQQTKETRKAEFEELVRTTTASITEALGKAAGVELKELRVTLAALKDCLNPLIAETKNIHKDSGIILKNVSSALGNVNIAINLFNTSLSGMENASTKFEDTTLKYESVTSSLNEVIKSTTENIQKTIDSLNNSLVNIEKKSEYLQTAESAIENTLNIMTAKTNEIFENIDKRQSKSEGYYKTLEKNMSFGLHQFKTLLQNAAALSENFSKILESTTTIADNIDNITISIDESSEIYINKTKIYFETIEKEYQKISDLFQDNYNKLIIALGKNESILESLNTTHKKIDSTLNGMDSSASTLQTATSESAVLLSEFSTTHTKIVATLDKVEKTLKAFEDIPDKATEKLKNNFDISLQELTEILGSHFAQFQDTSRIFSKHHEKIVRIIAQQETSVEAIDAGLSKTFENILSLYQENQNLVEHYLKEIRAQYQTLVKAPPRQSSSPKVPRKTLKHSWKKKYK